MSVRLSRDIWNLEQSHIRIAQAVSAIARKHGAVADRAAVQEVQIAIAAKRDAMDVGFWRAVLGYVSVAREQVKARLEAAVAAGGRIVDESHAPAHWTTSRCRPSWKICGSCSALFCLVVPLALAALAGMYGLYMFKRWGRSLSLCSTLAGLVLFPFSVPLSLVRSRAHCTKLQR